MSHPSIRAALEKLDARGREKAAECLTEIFELGLPEDLFADFVKQVVAELVASVEQERVLLSLNRFLQASRSPQGWLSLFEREPAALGTLLRLFATSQYMADLLVSDPEGFDLLRLTDGQAVDQSVLTDEILAAVAASPDLKAAMRVLRDYRHRETLRIAYGDFINHQSVETVTSQISILADALIEAAVWAAFREMERRRSRPLQVTGEPLAFSVLALGKLGGQELNYSSDVDLVFVREPRAATASWQRDWESDSSVGEFFERLAQLIIRLLGESTADGIAYRVDMRLRPHGRGGSLVVDTQQAAEYYDGYGRTWERQAFIKARAAAGDLWLGKELIEDLQPWVYRRYPQRADITGLVALKRRIEQRAERAGVDSRNVKLGHGGLRDIETVTQFLQLLHGAEQPSIRCAGTIEAIRQLQTAGCLTAEEQSLLEDNYRYLRRIEHHLQIMFDRQTHTLPSDAAEFDKVARRIEWESATPEEAGERLRQQLGARTTQNRQVLDHLLHDAFADGGYDAVHFACPESDLLFDPQPSPEAIQKTLSPYGFSDCQAAYQHLQDLATESISFLSTRRSRHFLAAIVPRLLAGLADMPNPDATLINLAHVSDSLGGKAVLWELFSANPPSMELCLRLCATSPYLTSILTSNPGMIDELLDSLMLANLPQHEQMAAGLEELCRGAVEIAPMLHSFKNSMHLRVGVRDILGKSSIQQTHCALSDIAEVCMERVIYNEFHRLVHELGVPVARDEQGAEQAAELVVLAVGKLGGREPNYHSDLDVIFLFQAEGSTKSLVPNRRFEPTTNRHFFNQLCGRVIHAVTRVGSTGRLYDLDVRLRPLGRSGQLAITAKDLERYFTDGQGQTWERQALCKARPIWGSPDARAQAMDTVHRVVANPEWSSEGARQIYDHRLQLEQGAAEGNLKRGAGGTMDVEFAVQMLQLAHVREFPDILVPGTLQAIDALEIRRLLEPATAAKFREIYQFLRSVESGIRLMNLSARHELPRDPDELERLAFLMKSRNRMHATGQQLHDRCQSLRVECRRLFQEICDRWLPAAEDAGQAWPTDE